MKDRKCRMCGHKLSQHARNIAGEVYCKAEQLRGKPWTVPDLLDFMPTLLIDEAERLVAQHNADMEEPSCERKQKQLWQKRKVDWKNAQANSEAIRQMNQRIGSLNNELVAAPASDDTKRLDWVESVEGNRWISKFSCGGEETTVREAIDAAMRKET